MAYRRRQGTARSSTFKEDITYGETEAQSSSLAAQAIRALAAHRDSSHSSAYVHSGFKEHWSKGEPTYDYTSTGSANETGSLWGVVARKAKSILDDDNYVPQRTEYLSSKMPEMFHSDQIDISKKMDNPTMRKGLDALTSSMNRIGDTIGNALEEGRTIVENKTADLIQETRKLQIRRKGFNLEERNLGSGTHFPLQHPTQYSQNLTNSEVQLKASRDVAMATAAKAKLLLRELKTVKADLAFAKQRCSQLEEENKILREAREKGVNPADDDDDMIRVQLETLLGEKARLGHENSVYARENRFLREIVEYHQLTMQEVVYQLDEEGIEDVYPNNIPAVSPPSPSRSSSVTKDCDSQPDTILCD